MRRRLPEAADLVLLGDSLAAGWPPDLITAVAPGRRVFNFGLPGDRVQNTLWRLREIPTGHLRPRDLVVLLGTNNLGDGDPPGAIAAGLELALAEARRLWAVPRTILVTIPRRGPEPGFREPDRLALNASLAGVGAEFLIDADAVLDVADGTPSLLPDRLHLSEDGYKRLSAALPRL
jgi:lysophospholipase L1-like esterase